MTRRVVAQHVVADLGGRHGRAHPGVGRVTVSLRKSVAMGLLDGDGSAALQLSGFSCGNRITSRIDGESVSSITSRSMPMPSPAVGGRPYSIARM